MKFLFGMSFLTVALLLNSCGGKAITASCNDNVKKLGIVKKTTVQCPANCSLTGSVWGTNDYTTDSAICLAGIHAGVIEAASGGKVEVEITPGNQSYTGSSNNGVTSRNWGPYQSSFRVK